MKTYTLKISATQKIDGNYVSDTYGAKGNVEDILKATSDVLSFETYSNLLMKIEENV
jgi:hypothetical protein